METNFDIRTSYVVSLTGITAGNYENPYVIPYGKRAKSTVFLVFPVEITAVFTVEFFFG
jgi:hypothetical protein